MNLFEQYSYVDGYFVHPGTGLGTPWMRIQAQDITHRVIEPGRNANCFASIQRFRDATRIVERQEGAQSALPLAEVGDEGEADRFPDQQLHYHGLFFDFDAKPKKDEPELSMLDRARREVVSVIQHLSASFELNPAHIQIWFSGKKGFHLLIRPEPFDIRPHQHLTYMVQKVALDLAHRLDLSTLDRSVYTLPRMWRLPNSIHHATGRFKIELTVNEITNFTLQQIVDKSHQPRLRSSDDAPGVSPSNIYDDDEYENVPPVSNAVAWWREYTELYQAALDLKNLRPKLPVIRPEGGSAYPMCMEDVLENGPKPGGGGRNRLLLPMVAFWKDAGIDKQEAQQLVRDWTQKHFSGEQHQIRDRLANGRSVVESIYRSDKYHFSCASMLSNKGHGVEGRIACAAPKCPWVKDPSHQDPVETPTLPLWSASRGIYVGKKVRFYTHVSGIAGHPFGIPVKGRITCTPDPEADICRDCPMLKRRNDHGKSEYIWEFSAQHRDCLTLIDVNDNRRKSTIKANLGIPPKCYKHKLETLETNNVEEVQIIPMVDTRVYREDETVQNDDDMSRKVARHVQRRGFHLGHGIQANKKYVVDAYVYEHPEDQRIVFLWDKMTHAQNDIDTYRMTPELYQQLLIFQQKDGQSVREKLEDIHRDLEANVHQIRGRFDLAIALDLAYHSVIGFTFQNKFVQKGWWELLVMGDSGTGKTTMLERLMQHYGLGEMIAGEESKRTGLVFASMQMSGQWILVWGKIPQNDRRLLAIDEFAAIPPEEVGKMTQLRSEGKARGQGVNSGQETWARTRLIFLTNARSGKSLAESNYGIEAIRDLFDEHQDLRRVDLAMCVKSDDVHRSVINQRWDAAKVDHKYTADLCRNLVLWAWSLDPSQITWEDDAENRVLYFAERLGDTYECDVPLAQHSDLRLKIARIACSVAARLFSTDSSAKRLIVKAEHVEEAAKRMDEAYRKKAMAFFEYARRYKQDNTFTADRKKRIRDGLKGFPDPDQLVATLLSAVYIAKGELMDMTGYDKDAGDKLWKLLIANQLIRKHGKGYRKTPAFTELLKEIGSTAAGYDGGERLPEPTETRYPPRLDYDQNIDLGGDEPPF